MEIIKRHNNIFVDEKYGLVKQIYDIPTYPGLPNIFVKMAFGSNYSTAGFNASGAGVTEQAAEIAAIGEYIERYSELHPLKENVHRLKYGENKSQVNPNIFTQYIYGETSVKKGDLIDWVWGECLLNRKKTLLPAEIFYLTYSSGEHRKWISNSTGAACAENPFQARWKGLAEAFERDAIQFMWRYQIPLKRFNIGSNKSVSNFYNTYIKSEGLKISLYRFVMDWDIPSVFGLAEFPNGAIVVSASVRVTWEDACIKTLIELAQSINGYASNIFDSNIIYSNPIGFEHIRNYQDHSLLYFNPAMRKYLSFLTDGKETADIPFCKKENYSDEECFYVFINELEKINKEAFYVDVTSPEIYDNGWTVGRTVVAGFLDIEPNFCKELRSSRLLEVKDYLIQHNILKSNEFATRQPLVPHPFP